MKLDEHPYQVCLLGANNGDYDELSKAFLEQTNALGIPVSTVKFLRPEELNERILEAPCAAVFFGYPGANTHSHPELDGLLQDSLLIVPIVAEIKKFREYVPTSLEEFNGVDAKDGINRAVTRMLEYFRLLRSERRLFISYKRGDSDRVAYQLYSALDAWGYDVFLDTRSVPIGDKFQDVLWDRLVDSDVVVLLDSDNFKDSPWGQMEYARAISSNIQIIHLLWPGVPSADETAFDSFHAISKTDFAGKSTVGEDVQLSAAKIGEVVQQVENCRSAALAVRNRMLIDDFCDFARDQKLEADLQPELNIKLTSNTKEVVVVPMVGVPSALRLHQAVEAASVSGETQVWALYDNLGVLERTLFHLDWLNEKLPIVAVSKLAARELIENLDP